jgi:uncharacterized protein (UPF0335 family)
MTLEPETITLSHDRGSLTFTGDEVKAVTASLRSLAETPEDFPLKALANRVLFLKNEMRAIREDIATLYNDAKGDGYNLKALRLLVKIMEAQADAKKRQEMLEVSGCLQLYAHHVGQPLLPGMAI